MIEEHSLHFKETVRRWDEAIPLGNGLTGALIWGNGKPLRFSLDRGDLWDTRLASEVLSKEYTYKNLINWVKENKEEEIHKLYDNSYNNNATPTKLPAGRLELIYEKEALNVESILNLEKAEGEITLNFEEGKSVVNAFLHATDKYGYIKVKGNINQPEVKIIMHDFTSEDYKGQNTVDSLNTLSLKSLGYPKAEKGQEGNIRWILQRTCEDLSFAIVVGEKNLKDELHVVYYLACSNDGENWLQNSIEAVKQALEQGYDKCLKMHIEWWKNYWSKSQIDLSDKYFEKQWYLTNYIFASCSRKGAPPMPLQGVWTADEGKLPPWKGDYHNDLNTQLSYSHYCKANHLEEGESFIDFLWKLVPAGREFARKFYDAEGVNLPSVMTIDGKSLGGWCQYALSITNQAWLCQSFHKHWKYTKNKEFLREKAYPYLKETAVCILRWLQEDENGKLVLPLSSSPEIHGNSMKAWLKPNSNYDLALLINLFKALVEEAEELGEDKITWEETLKKLPELAVNNRNVLRLSQEEDLIETHRHHSHAMAIYPLDLLDYSKERDKKIIDATIGDLEVLGIGLWVGYSFAWMANLYARQKNGEGAAFRLRNFWEATCSQNGFHLNGDFKNMGVNACHYRPFTLEGNMCAADALQEMLLQSHHEVIRVFPAVPNEWKEKGAKFNNLRAEGAILVSAEIKDNKLQYIEVYAEKDGTFKIENSFTKDELTICKEDNEDIIKVPRGKIFRIELKSGEGCKIY